MFGNCLWFYKNRVTALEAVNQSVTVPWGGSWLSPSWLVCGVSHPERAAVLSPRKRSHSDAGWDAGMARLSHTHQRTEERGIDFHFPNILQRETDTVVLGLKPSARVAGRSRTHLPPPSTTHHRHTWIFLLSLSQGFWPRWLLVLCSIYIIADSFRPIRSDFIQHVSPFEGHMNHRSRPEAHRRSACKWFRNKLKVTEEAGRCLSGWNHIWRFSPETPEHTWRIQIISQNIIINQTWRFYRTSLQSSQLCENTWGLQLCAAAHTCVLLKL